MSGRLPKALVFIILSVALASAAWAGSIHGGLGGGSNSANQDDEGKKNDKESGDSDGNGGGNANQNTGGGGTQNAGLGSTLHIGFGAGTSCAVGCGGDPNVSGISNPTAFFDIYQNSNGAPAWIDPVLLILGVPNETEPNLFSQSSIVELTSINSYPGGAAVSNSWTYGTTAFGLGSDVGFGAASGYRGEFAADTRGDVYSFLGLAGGNNSNNWTNWHGADLAWNGIDATGFGIYVFALNAELGPNGLINIGFLDSNTVPAGTYLIGYGPSSTPFTEAGLYSGGPPVTTGGPAVSTGPSCSGDCTRVPEPDAMLLLAGALIGLVAWRNRN